jgi:hypothetical protein
MNVNSPESQNENQIKASNIEPSLYNADKLINISTQAKILAWFILVISIVLFVVATINFSMDYFYGSDYGYAPGFNDLAFYLASFFPALIGLFLYIILRFVAESIFLFMDIEINFREQSERQK